MTIRRRVTFCPAFPPPPQARARPDWSEIFGRCWTGGFEASVSPTPAPPRSDAEHAQLSAGRLCDVPALRHELLASHGRSNGRSQSKRTQRTEANASTPTALPNTANGRARFCADLPLGWAKPIS